MLVLSRKLNDSIVIGDGIEITVIAIDRNRVKVGIEAPQTVSIVRSELLESISTASNGQDMSISKDGMLTFEIESPIAHSPK